VSNEELENLFDSLWPLNRSLTGDSNRKTLKILSEKMPLEITEVDSGTKCFDWEVPSEWNVREAYISDSDGKRLIDFGNNNLHLVGYSICVDTVMNFDELDEQLHYIESHPDWIPYKTSYYKRDWGFCLSYNQYIGLDRNAKYHVVIDSTLDEHGSMTYGEVNIEGESDELILLSTYICHPSMANNELSGPLVTTLLYETLSQTKPFYSYKFLFIPETIGCIYYLSKHLAYLKKHIIAGLVVTTIGDDAPFNYKRSRRGDAAVDRAAELVLSQSSHQYYIHDFYPWGSDERQYCSPGVNLPVGSLMRSSYEVYQEYHTSADDKNFISFSAMQQSAMVYLNILELIQANRTYTNVLPYGEPQLGKRNLFPNADNNLKDVDLEAIMWILNLADGNNDLINIVSKSGLDYKQIVEMAILLQNRGLLK